MAVSLGMQVGVNLANDYFDGRSGVDRADRVGPLRVTSAGLVTPAKMRMAMALAFSISAIAGTALAITVGPELFVVGIICVVAALGYSGGPRPYASIGLGEVFVFIFFGLVATTGSAYVQTHSLTMLDAIAGIPVGLLATSILVLNNLRDIPTDERAGKRTLAVRLGREWTVRLYVLFMIVTFVMLAPIAVLSGSLLPSIALVSLPLAVQVSIRVRTLQDAPSAIRNLVATARLQLVYGVLLALGLVLR